jgi:putative N6-adenine-specific DNA methylase
VRAAVSNAPFELFVACAPGLESLLAQELSELALTPRPTAGGVTLHASLAELYRVLLGAGLALKALLRLGTFHAAHFAKFEHALQQLDWGRLLGRGQCIDVRVSSSKSKLYHTGAIRERVLRVLAAEVGAFVSDDDARPALAVHVRIERDLCTLSVDLGGEPLHKRGYRKETGKAPLREDVARALLRLAQHDAAEALVDPLCGAGTFPIEGYLLASHTPPNARRSFAVERLPLHDADVLVRERARLLAETGPAHAVRRGSDRDRGVIAAAERNAERAGLAQQTSFRACALSAVELPDGPCLIIANPPYGVRIGDANKLVDLYAALGTLRRRSREARLALVTANPRLAAATGVPLESALMTDLGGLKVCLYVERDQRGKSPT